MRAHTRTHTHMNSGIVDRYNDPTRKKFDNLQ
jgi:hypothetical protein